jgi:hypothetical protein
MRTKVIFASLFLSLAFISCKNEEKKEEVKPVEVVKANTFDVVIDAAVKSNEGFQLFYTDKDVQWFEETQSVWFELKGDEKPQTITLSVPEGIEPKNLRLDFGTNVDQKPIVLNKVQINYNGKSFEIIPAEFDLYFKGNESITFDKVTATVTTHKDEKGNFDPIFVAQPILFGRVAKELKK